MLTPGRQEVGEEAVSLCGGHLLDDPALGCEVLLADLPQQIEEIAKCLSRRGGETAHGASYQRAQLRAGPAPVNGGTRGVTGALRAHDAGGKTLLLGAQEPTLTK